MKFSKLPSGKTHKGKEIEAYITSTSFEVTKFTYLIAGVHGDEPEGVYLLKKLFEWLSKDTSHVLNLPLIIIPLLNADGSELNTRGNANGVDLNRNLPSKNWSPVSRGPRYFPGTSPLSEPENIFLTKLFAQYPPQFILSFHSWYRVINYNGPCEQVAQFLSKHNTYPIEKEFDNHPTPGSLGEYAAEMYNSQVLTLEAPVLENGLTLDMIWEENQSALQGLFCPLNSPLRAFTILT